MAGLRIYARIYFFNLYDYTCELLLYQYCKHLRYYKVAQLVLWYNLPVIFCNSLANPLSMADPWGSGWKGEIVVRASLSSSCGLLSKHSCKSIFSTVLDVRTGQGQCGGAPPLHPHLQLIKNILQPIFGPGLSEFQSNAFEEGSLLLQCRDVEWSNFHQGQF